MKVELTRQDLETLVRGTAPDFSLFSNPLVTKAGHEYFDHGSRDRFTSLHELSESELWRLYKLCKHTKK